MHPRCVQNANQNQPGRTLNPRLVGGRLDLAVKQPRVLIDQVRDGDFLDVGDFLPRPCGGARKPACPATPRRCPCPRRSAPGSRRWWKAPAYRPRGSCCRSATRRRPPKQARAIRAGRQVNEFAPGLPVTSPMANRHRSAMVCGIHHCKTPNFERAGSAKPIVPSDIHADPRLAKQRLTT